MTKGWRKSIALLFVLQALIAICIFIASFSEVAAIGVTDLRVWLPVSELRPLQVEVFDRASLLPVAETRVISTEEVPSVLIRGVSFSFREGLTRYAECADLRRYRFRFTINGESTEFLGSFTTLRRRKLASGECEYECDLSETLFTASVKDEPRVLPSSD